MTSIPPASPIADLLLVAPGSAAGEGGGLRTFPGEAALPGAADFAALLQNAGLAAPPLVAAESRTAPEQATVEPDGDPVATGSVVDGLLFLAAVHAPVAGTAPLATAVAVTARGAAEPRSSADKVVADKRGIADTKGIAMPLAVADAASQAPEARALATADNAPTPAALPGALRPDGDTLMAALEGKRDAIAADRSPRPAIELENAPTAAAQPAVPRAMVDASLTDRDSRPATARGVEPTASLSASQGASAPPPLTVTIETPVHDASWRADAATRIVSLVTRGIEHAEVRVTPPDLGPVELRIDVRGGEATLAIVATHAATRDALEQALPMLREMLAQHGLSLGQASVADGRADPQSSGSGTSPHAETFAGNAAPDERDASRSARIGIARGLIDVFA